MSLREQIAKSLETNIEFGAGRYISSDGIFEVTWLPDENTGYIDIKNPGNKLSFSQLKKKSLEYISQLPKARWEFNPDDPQKGRIYAKLFEGLVEPNPHMPNNALVFNTRDQSFYERALNIKPKLSPLGHKRSILTKSEYKARLQEGLNSGKYAFPSDAYNDLGMLYDNGKWLRNMNRKGVAGFKSLDATRANKRSSNRTRYTKLKQVSDLAADEFKSNQLLASDYTALANEDLLTQRFTKGAPFVADHNVYPKDSIGRSQVIDPVFDQFKQLVERSAQSANFMVDVNTQGQVITGPSSTYNEFDPGSSLDWVVIEDYSNKKQITDTINKAKTKHNNKIKRKTGGSRVLQAITNEIDAGIPVKDGGLLPEQDVFYDPGDVVPPIHTLGPGPIPIRL